MKIFEAISDTNIGGAGVLLLTRLLNDPKMCSQTTVIIPEGSRLKERLEDNGIKFIELCACQDRSFDFLAIFKYFRLLKKYSPDIVNCHGCLSFRIAAFLYGVPVRVYTRHCAFPLKKWQKNFFARAIIGRLQAVLSNEIIAVAHVARDNLIEMGVKPDRINVIINGVNGLERLSEDKREQIKKRLEIPDNAKVIGIFARLEACKGHMTLIEAAERLTKENEEYRFLVVGGGRLGDKLKYECVRRGLEKIFIFTGFIDDVTEIFNITDVNVNCSLGTETSSLALSEGMSLGIPAVASDYGGNKYMVRDGVNGLIFRAGDSGALAECIRCVTGDSILYQKLSEGAFDRFVSELNAKQMTRHTYDLYNKRFLNR